MLFKDAEVTVKESVLSVGKDRSRLPAQVNKLKLKEEDKLLFVSSGLTSSNVSFLFGSCKGMRANWTNIFFFFCCVCILHNSCSYISVLESCILKNELMERIPTTTASIYFYLLTARAVQTFHVIHS